jgi:hypothetical protein
MRDTKVIGPQVEIRFRAVIIRRENASPSLSIVEYEYRPAKSKALLQFESL